MYLITGEYGTPLKDILKIFGNVNIPIIECRTRYKDENESYCQRDDLFGFCEYKDGKLLSLDGDTYSLENLYTEWELILNYTKPEDYIDRLIVWQSGRLTNNYDEFLNN